MSKDAWKEPFLNTTPFDHTKAFQLLQQQAKTALDLTDEKVFTKERIESFQVKTKDFLLAYPFQRVTKSVMNDLFMLSKERRVLEQMQAMQSGKPINWIEGFESENRMVLHTACRSFFSQGHKEKEIERAEEFNKTELEKLEKFLHGIEGTFEELIVVGIGGSELGPRALYEALLFYRKPNKRVHFIGNVDPDDVIAARDSASLKKSLVVVISKSGTTIETTTNEAFLRAIFEEAGLDPKKHFIAVTMPKTPMDDPKRYLACFYLLDAVGGRYSSTSMVGGVLLGFSCGYDQFITLLQGAHAMDLIACKDQKENIPLIGALLGIWNHNFLGYPTIGVIPYSRVLHRFSAHLQQCDMESNGKSIDRRGQKVHYATGPVLWGEPGTNAQHSFFQLLHQGTSIVPLDLIGCAEAQQDEDFIWEDTTSHEKLIANMFAQAVALACGKKNNNPNKSFSGNRPVSLILVKKITPYTLGMLLSYYEHRTAFQGFILGINSFDQEGVQLGKKTADAMLEVFKKRRVKEGKDYPLGEMLINLFSSLE